MPPTNPLGRKPPQSQLKNGTLAALAAAVPYQAVGNRPKTQYEELQEDELIALSSIYGADFRRIESNNSAWQKSEPSFEIRMKSSDDEIAATLSATLTATYPKTLPLLSLKDDGGIRDGTRFKLRKILETKPKELLPGEQAMIMEIVNACLDVLEDAAQSKAAGLELPSLEEERAAHEAAAAILAQEQKDEEDNKRRLQTLEEEQMLGSLVQDELKRQKAKAKETRQKNRPVSTMVTRGSLDNITAADESITFDQPVILDGKESPISFQTVYGKVCIRRGPVSKCFTVRPADVEFSSDVPILVLKQTNVEIGSRDHNAYKVQLQALETELEALKKIRHHNILDVFDFKLHKAVDQQSDLNASWTVSLLCEFADKGSLEEFLEIAGNLMVVKIRSWTIKLLDALRFLHDHGIVHADIHPGNVLLVREPTGEVRPTIADAGYQRKLHNLSGKAQPADTISVAKSAYWLPPEIANTSQPQYTQKTDVWDFGILFLQMIFGLTVVQKYVSPMALADSVSLSDSLSELVYKLFKADPKKRPRAFELSSSEFLATDAEILEEYTAGQLATPASLTSYMSPKSRRPRHDSMNAGGPLSRYREDFVEEGRLGKGGFGEVVKARKKLDGQIYAIKKITQKSSASLTEVLKEVRLLSQLSHPSVVRYYNTWTEEVADVSETDDDVTTQATETNAVSAHGVPEGNDHVDLDFGTSTGGLDFMSSSDYPQIEFGYEDESGSHGESVEKDEDEDDEDSASPDNAASDSNGMLHNHLGLRRTTSSSRQQRPFKTVLYISMEYCEKRTLRDLIKRGLHKEKEEIWRLFRQVLEGLAHIHGLNVVHRDLKPENIFIDAASNVKIGDFGLATSGQYTAPDKVSLATSHTAGDMTRSIGTAFYIAPEVRSAIGGTYTAKVDMFSLGLIFFEMCYRPMIIAMERAQVNESLRKNPPVFPSDFDTTEVAVQVNIILSLLNNNPKDRPSSSELLKSGKLPMQMESETIRQALASLSDSRSPYYHKMMSALFSMPTKHAKDFAWDLGAISHSASDLVLQGLVKEKLISIFKHHGAVETPRTMLFPRSRHYGPNTVQLLDQNGILLQLPYDLTLPHARALAKHEPSVQRSFAFGPVFRDRQSGAQPQSFGEVDFDIVSTDSLDMALKEAEVIKVLDEIVTSFPSLAGTQMCFEINHSDLLALVFDFCRIEVEIRQGVSDTLSKLNVQSWSWQKIRAELRSPLIGISATSVDDLERFDFRDSPNKAFQKLKTIFEGTDIFDRAASSIAHIRDVIDYAKRFEVQSRIYVNPLGSLREKFCKGGVIFSCLYDRKVRDVFAAGGRYDSLIREHRHVIGTQADERHAVGFNLAWEKLARLPKTGGKGFLKKPEEEVHGIWNTRRCDVLVASHDPSVLRSTGITLIQHLWANSISASLAADSRYPEDLLLAHRSDPPTYLVLIKADSSLRIKTLPQPHRKDTPDIDIPATQLIPWLKSELVLRERENNLSLPSTSIRGKLPRRPSLHLDRATLHNTTHNTTADIPSLPEQEVRVLFASSKSKKSNRRGIIEQAQSRAAALVQSFLDGPILAIEATDAVLELMRGTRLSDAEDWRRVVQSVAAGERRYVGEVWEQLERWKGEVEGLGTGKERDGRVGVGRSRNAFLYNLRSGLCVYYDLGA